MPAAYAMQIIEETHHSWQLLVTGEKDRVCGDDSMADSGVASSTVLIVPAPDAAPVEPAPLGFKRNLSYPKLNLEEISANDTTL
jgi:hypothetical protein